MPVKANPDDAILIRDLSISCVLGLHQHERDREQAIKVDIDLLLPLASVAETGKLSDSIDYSSLINEITFVLKTGRFKLLESGCRHLLRLVLAPPPEPGLRAQPLAARVRLQKRPRSLGSGSVSVVMEGRLTELRYPTGAKALLKPFLLAKSSECELYRLSCPKERAIPQALTLQPNETELEYAAEGWRHRHYLRCRSLT